MSPALKLAGLLAVSTMLAQSMIRAAHADDLPVVNVNNEVGVSFSELIKNYKEFIPDNAPAHDRENGAVRGFAVSGSIMRNLGQISNVYASVNFRYSKGNIAYNGATLVGNVPLMMDSGLVQKSLRFELGRGFLVTPRLLIIPVFQYGYQAWNRDIGYQETYTESYMGGAVHVDYALTPRLVGRLRAGIASTVGPHITIVDEDDTSNGSLGIRPVYQLGGGFDYALTQRIHLTADADYSHYSFGRTTDFRDGTFEPSSSTNDLYVEGGVAYHF